jgi:predicted site-specific integrase-resolvase
MIIKLSEYAKIKNVCYKTAFNWFKKGKILNSYQNKNTKTIMVEYIDSNLENILIIKQLLNKIEKNIKGEKCD